VDNVGIWNTGYTTFNMPAHILASATGLNDCFDMTSSQRVGGLFLLDTVSTLDFRKTGIIRKEAAVRIVGGEHSHLEDGLILEDCELGDLSGDIFTNNNPANTTGRGLTITGAATKTISCFNTRFNMSNADQRPVRVDPSVVAAEFVVLQNSPDNNVADEYFDTSTGGLDETNKQVIADRNGLRRDSMLQSESRTDPAVIIDEPPTAYAPMLVGGAVDVKTPLNRGTVGDFELDSTTEGFSIDSTTGNVTYDGLAPKNVTIQYSLKAAQDSGGAQTLEFDMDVGGVPQPKAMERITTVGSGFGNLLRVAFPSGNFDIKNGDEIELFKTNTTNGTLSQIVDVLVIIRGRK